MKIYNKKFEEYVNYDISLHPNIINLYDNLPENIMNFDNIIVYGQKGIGKYSQILNLIKKYSPSNLKYEKKLQIEYNKNDYFYKMSDIHIEIDMELLGCNSKLLWNEFYYKIVDITLSKKVKCSIILCKNFHEIHQELLDNFYSYMQSLLLDNIKIIYMISTEHISFIPNNILDSCKKICLKKPSKKLYNMCNYDYLFINKYKNICDIIINCILDVNDISFLKIREEIYNIFIYNLNIYECIYYILEVLVYKNKIKKKDMNYLIYHTYYVLQYYNNNYRPIFHLEKFIFNLIKIINDY